jgi:large subunit ribosomal protein L4
MPKVDIVNITGKKVGEMDLVDDVFGIMPNDIAIHTVVKAQLANRRQGTQSALTRAEVSGGGIKPWRQKGTGRARQGSTRSPQWRTGGVVFAPKPRDYHQDVNRKLRRLAMKSALSSKVKDGELILLDDIAFKAPKTKTMEKALVALNADRKTLLVLDEPNRNVELSARNLPYVKTIVSGTLNIYDLMNCDRVILTQKAAQMIAEVYAK